MRDKFATVAAIFVLLDRIHQQLAAEKPVLAIEAPHSS
jgi:hypothetical protein